MGTGGKLQPNPPAHNLGQFVLLGQLSFEQSQNKLRAPGDGEDSLGAFMRNFCSKDPVITPEALDVHRSAMTQPNCYFTLETPFVNFIGLYSNVPSGGRIKEDQLEWFVGELKNADKDKGAHRCRASPGLLGRQPP